MKKLFRVEGHIQHYEWGGTRFISDLLGLAPSQKKCAEYWLGAHDKAPSVIKSPMGSQPFNAFLEIDLAQNLGEGVAKKFGRLPFLFKVLDVAEALSIQVHPTKVEAEKGYKEENAMGVPLSAPNRNFKDNNHKPEIMVALSEFWLLHGFLEPKKLIKILENTPELESLSPLFLEEGYFGLYKYVMQLSDAESADLLRPLKDRILPLFRDGKLSKSQPDYWAAKAFDSDESAFDKGIFSIYFFNLIQLKKGEAIFQDAGLPHAYLEGQNIELMANSDNVLRGGLTPKHVDVPALLKHVVFDPTIPNILQGEMQDDGLEIVYRSSAPDFELSQIRLSNAKTYLSTSKTVEIFIVIEGDVLVKENNNSLAFKKGEAFATLAQCSYQITTHNKAVLYKAKTPI